MCDVAGEVDNEYYEEGQGFYSPAPDCEFGALFDPGDQFEDVEYRFVGQAATITVRQVKREYCLLVHSTGMTVWRACDVACDYLARNFGRLVPDTSTHVLELGCGAGVLGILLARLGVARITLTDGDSPTLALAHQNCSNNNCLMESSLKTLHLRWGTQFAPQFFARHCKWFSDIPVAFVAGNDIVYVKESLKPIFETVDELRSWNIALGAPPPTLLFTVTTRTHVSCEHLTEEASRHSWLVSQRIDAAESCVILLLQSKT